MINSENLMQMKIPFSIKQCKNVKQRGRSDVKKMKEERKNTKKS